MLLVGPKKHDVTDDVDGILIRPGECGLRRLERVEVGDVNTLCHHKLRVNVVFYAFLELRRDIFAKKFYRLANRGAHDVAQRVFELVLRPVIEVFRAGLPVVAMLLVIPKQLGYFLVGGEFVLV